MVIGQIHAKNDEPIRLYYRKLPQNKYGSIYFAHDPETGKEVWVDVIGGRGDRIANPEDGIALDEIFSYEIKVTGRPEGDRIIPMLHLKIIRDDGTEVVAEPFDMRDSGFSVEDEFMFFKAGAYTGNNTSPAPETDFDRVIFYALDYTHDAPPADGPPLTKTTAQRSPAPAAPASPGIVFDDSFADGGRDDGSDASDSNWWTTSNSSSIEVSQGRLGLVSGGSGRGIRTTFAPQMLTEGHTLKASFTFETPATTGHDRGAAFRVGLFDTLGRGALEGDLSASSKSPNATYDGLPGYLITYDVNTSRSRQYRGPQAQRPSSRPAARRARRMGHAGRRRRVLSVRGRSDLYRHARGGKTRRGRRDHRHADAGWRSAQHLQPDRPGQ